MYNFLTEIFRAEGFVGLFALSGWIAGIASTSAIYIFFNKQVKEMRRRFDGELKRNTDRASELLTEFEKQNELWRKQIHKHEEISNKIIRDITETNIKLIEKINSLQMFLLQILGK